jgi:hypothetical protein
MAQRNDRKIVEDFLFRYFRRYARLPPHISSQRKLKEISGVNVEEVFTFLSERIAAPSTNTNVRDEFDGIIWPALVRTVAYTFSKFNANAETKRHYRRFQKGLLRSHDSIVSFNYDTVAENSLTKAWHYAGINGPGGIPVYKPHGSVNWCINPTGTIGIDDNPAVPLIVAPTHLKFTGLQQNQGASKVGYLDQHSQLRLVWEQMESQLQQAKALAFIGYSFPEADLYFSSVLRSVLSRMSKGVLIIIVNPDAWAICQRLASRFAIPIQNFRLFFELKSFVQMKRADLIA